MAGNPKAGMLDHGRGSYKRQLTIKGGTTDVRL